MEATESKAALLLSSRPPPLVSVLAAAASVILFNSSSPRTVKVDSSITGHTITSPALLHVTAYVAACSPPAPPTPHTSAPFNLPGLFNDSRLAVIKCLKPPTLLSRRSDLGDVRARASSPLPPPPRGTSLLMRGASVIARTPPLAVRTAKQPQPQESSSIPPPAPRLPTGSHTVVVPPSPAGSPVSRQRYTWPLSVPAARIPVSGE